MPIPAGDFADKGTEISEVKRTNVTAGVEDFLRENADQAFSTKDVHEATEFNRATVNQVLLKLAKAKKTERKSVDGTIFNRWVGGEPESDESKAEPEE